MKKTILYIWQLPQHILALILILAYGAWKNGTVLFKGRKYYYSDKISGGISLGEYIILSPGGSDAFAQLHEYGHSEQSRYLGPLYLLVIGLPSLVGNIYDRLFHTPKHGWSYGRSLKWYYNQPWEKWADKLGCVERNNP